MQKIPVFDIVVRAYRFPIAEFGTIFRLSWFLFSVVALAKAFTEGARLRAAIETIRRDASPARPTFDWTVMSAGVLEMVALAVVAVALHRVIIFGDRKPGRLIYFSVEKVEMAFILLGSLFAAMVLLPVLNMLIAYVAAGRFGLLPEPLSARPDYNPGVGPLALAVYFIGILALSVAVAATLATRLSPVLPMAVVEKRIHIRGAWRLSRGRCWRLFSVWAVGSLPPLVLSIGLGHLAGFSDVKSLSNPPADPSLQLADLERQVALLYPRMLFECFWSFILGAVGVALLSYSYKALNDYPLDRVLAEHPPER